MLIYKGLVSTKEQTSKHENEHVESYIQIKYTSITDVTVSMISLKDMTVNMAKHLSRVSSFNPPTIEALYLKVAEEVKIS